MSKEHTPASGIVILGASAGGLESLECFFDGLPDIPNLAYVVVQHLSPDHETMMDRLIARHTSMPVKIVDDGEAVLAKHVYVLPPKCDLLFSEDRFRLKPQDRSVLPYHPIDLCLQSAADQWGARCIAVILSGSGSDGSRGCLAIRGAGGMVMAESLETAKFSGMPKAVQDAGVANEIMAPEQMGDQLLECRLNEDVQESTEVIGEEELEQVLDVVRQRCDIDFQHYKISTLIRRITRRMSMAGKLKFGEYLSYLKENEAESDLLYKDILIGVTRFFRDPGCFRLLEREVLPRLIHETPLDEPLRIWVAGCATGEEAYSIAISVAEINRRQSRDIDFKIFATDIHPGSLRRAAAGSYSAEALGNLPPALRTRYFTEEGQQYSVRKSIRSHVVFTVHNILTDPPFTNLDLVTCRNMLIYLDDEGQKKALSMFHFGLRMGGCLFLGGSETVGALAEEFDVIDDRCRLFEKRTQGRLPSAMKLHSSAVAGRTAVNVEPPALESTGKIRLYDRMMDQLIPSTILLNENREIVEAFGGSERYLSVPRRSFNQDVLSFLPRELQGPIASMLRRSAKTHEPLHAIVSDVEWNDKRVSFDIRVQRLEGRPEEPEYRILQLKAVVQRIDSDDNDPDSSKSEAQLDQSEIGVSLKERLRFLEDELEYSRQHLQSTIEELEASNEELQSTNEELIASNEELQSANEELNSVNEELHTLNIEFQNQNAELRELNEDMNHLFISTDVGTVFLDLNLCIRRYTPQMAQIFHLQETDIGRPLLDFSHSLNYDLLGQQLQEVLEKGEELEAQVIDESERHFLLRILPYRVEDEIEGIVLTLTEVTTLIETQRLAKKFESRLQKTIDAVPVFVSYINRDEVFEYANKAYETRLLPSGESTVGKTIHEILGPITYEISKPFIDAALMGEPQHFENVVETKEGKKIALSVAYIPSIENGVVEGFFVSGADVTETKLAEIELAKAVDLARQANRAKSDFLAKMSHEIRSPMTAILGFVDMLDEQLSNPDNRSSVDVIRQNGKHLLSIINDILDLSRIESGNLELHRVDFDLADLIADCHNSAQPLADSSDVELTTSIDEEQDWWIHEDNRRLQQIIINLLSNAVKFSRGGSVQLCCERRGQRLVLSVKDTGCGIPGEFIDDLFEPFCQAENANDRKFEGTGLGLTICKQLAEQMQGTISVNSTVGEGTTFIVDLPWEDAHENPGPNEESNAGFEDRQARLDGKRILVIDDRRDMRFIAEHVLSEAGALVETADSGPRGLEQACQFRDGGTPFDVIVTDIQMPEMDGYATTRALRASGFKQPILALSASAMQEDRQKAIDAGCSSHCPKPIDRKQFVSELARLVSRREKASE